ncbi:hypothetical protein ASPACDRAFT_1857281 [Aspergillus aculeatus ATCC 16872]|uniref:DUF985 domain-containing protein n=1 Tax=Aspergillus aculeatus (strain ATCC 16872 / CBS 172.66 / WB 5094) TaxID=690307 RepID=A0A1L9WRL6_ASPA1|nr:uncharacterized protein ASPACDRAFT_1857281 [Aspergillus aculeatus ATCC 16872]OJJ98784.1 hypothetical protein ASPACDRAFT_1857281 [Aspergillus aculeatus ATCC 16872]
MQQGEGGEEQDNEEMRRSMQDAERRSLEGQGWGIHRGATVLDERWYIGGYFHQTDRHPLTLPTPWAEPSSSSSSSSPQKHGTRSLSTTITYLLAPSSAVGVFHRNKGRTVHSLHRGRGRYVLLREDAPVTGDEDEDEANGEGRGRGRSKGKGQATVETFVVGMDTQHGERMQWVVEGGVWKGCFLETRDIESDHGNGFEGMLISETVMPGFEMEDHEFLTRTKMEEMLTEEQTQELQWMLRENHPELPSL